MQKVTDCKANRYIFFTSEKLFQIQPCVNGSGQMIMEKKCVCVWGGGVLHEHNASFLSLKKG